MLAARTEFPDASLADLYDPLVTPFNLVQTHRALNRAVDIAYGRPKGGWERDADRAAFLFSLYQTLAAPMDVPAAPTRKRRRTSR